MIVDSLLFVSCAILSTSPSTEDGRIEQKIFTSAREASIWALAPRLPVLRLSPRDFRLDFRRDHV